MFFFKVIIRNIGYGRAEASSETDEPVNSEDVQNLVDICEMIYYARDWS